MGNLFLLSPDLEVRLVYRQSRDGFAGYEGVQEEGEIIEPFDRKKWSQRYLDFKEYIFFHEFRHEMQDIRNCLNGRIFTDVRKAAVKRLGLYYTGNDEEREKKVCNRYNPMMPEEIDAETFAEMIMFLKPVLKKLDNREILKLITR